MRTNRPFWLEEPLWSRAIKRSDTVVTVFVVDPIIRLVLPLFLRAGISPNAATMLGLGLTLVNAWLFYTGHLVSGGVLFLICYVVDCIDGKIARLTDRCTKFGYWLDGLTDRIGSGLTFFALGMFFIDTGDVTTGLLCFAFLCLWFVNILTLQGLVQVSASFRTKGLLSATDASGPEPTTRNWERRIKNARAWLQQQRLTPLVFEGVEWHMCAAAVGPVTGFVRECLIVGCVAYVLQTSMISFVFWWRRRGEIGTA